MTAQSNQLVRPSHNLLRKVSKGFTRLDKLPQIGLREYCERISRDTSPRSGLCSDSLNEVRNRPESALCNQLEGLSRLEGQAVFGDVDFDDLTGS